MTLSEPKVLSSELLRRVADASSEELSDRFDVNLKQELAAIVGQKVVGILDIPPCWGIQNFVAIPTWICNSFLASQDREVLEISIALALDHLKVGQRPIIIRSSMTEEGMAFRGQFRSIELKAADISSTAAAASEILRHFTTTNSPGRCALLLHEYIEATAWGHMSNERRIGPKRKFLAEWETKASQTPSIATLQSNKKTAVPNTTDIIRAPAGRSPRNGLRQLCRWIDQNLGRAHIEWIASAGRLIVVQCDREEQKASSAPMSNWDGLPPAEPLSSLSVFSIAVRDTIHDLRKTRSICTFEDAGLPTAPLYILREAGVLSDLARGFVDEKVSADLDKLVACPLTLRIDVLADGHEDWHNLPASSPIHSKQAAIDFLVTAAADATKRAAATDLAIVAHHFIPARASAWAECNPHSKRVRIDATWGHPDGLQSFPCDTVYLSLAEDRQVVYKRYKDSFLDIASDGTLVRRESGDPWDRKEVLKNNETEHIATSTFKIANHLGRRVRVMWFVGTDGRMGMPRQLPWIVVDDLHEEEDLYLQGKSESPIRRLNSTSNHARRLNLGLVRRIQDEHDLEDFIKDSKPFDLGGRRMVFRPSEKKIRDKEFLRRLAGVGKERRWRVVLEGSTLAHNWYLLKQHGVDVESSNEYHTSPKRRRIFEKLVRDKIPTNIQEKGELVSSVKLAGDELLQELRRKLVEEALEALAAKNGHDLTEELADVLEVMKSLARQAGSDLDEVIRIAEKKRRVKGGFDEGFLLIATGGESEVAPVEHLRAGRSRLERRGQRLRVSIPTVPSAGGGVALHDFFRIEFAGTDFEIRIQRSKYQIRLDLVPGRGHADDRQLSLELTPQPDDGSGPDV